MSLKKSELPYRSSPAKEGEYVKTSGDIHNVQSQFLNFFFKVATMREGESK
jgi:hypothetical protein